MKSTIKAFRVIACRETDLLFNAQTNAPLFVFRGAHLVLCPKEETPQPARPMASSLSLLPQVGPFP